MDLREIKQRICTDDKLSTLLEALDCEHIHEEQGGQLIVCQLPPKFNSDNRRSVQIRNNESMWGYIRSRGITGDIYSIVGYILYDLTDFDAVKDRIYDIKQWICNTLGYEEDSWDGTITKDWNSWLRPIQKSRPREIYEIENEVLDESVLDRYIPFPHMLWVKDGITAQTQYQFGVAYDLDSDRIVYPVHNKHGQLIGVKGRYVGNDPFILDNFKYIPLEPWAKGIELYNLHRAAEYIRARNEVIAVESAKSCMRLTQWGYPNVISIEGFPMSQTQVRLLKELRVPIVMALDRDVELAQVKEAIKCVKNRLTYIISDTENLLSGKESPTDRGKEVWEQLYATRAKNY